MMRYEREEEIIRSLEGSLQGEALYAYQNGYVDHARYKANNALTDTLEEIARVFGGDSSALSLMAGAVTVTTKFMIKNEDISGAKELFNSPWAFAGVLPAFDKL